MSEAALYERAWSHERYRVASAGEILAAKFVEVAEPRKGDTVRDLGCGTARAALVFHKLGLNVELFDFADNCRDPEVVEAGLPFTLHDLRQPIPGPPARYGYCCDVLEHIAPRDVPRVLWHVVRAARFVFINVSCAPDLAGPELLNEPLHLTVEDYAWWKARLEDDLRCRVLWSHEGGNYASFYVSAYASGIDFIERSKLNTGEERLRENIRTNLAAGYEELMGHEVQDADCVLLAGGPSLGDFEAEIRERRAAGAMLATVNGTYHWALERGITPSVQIVCDARPFNKRFVEPALPRVRYLLASQVDPTVATAVPKEQVLIWHSGDAYGVPEELGLEKWKQWLPVFGGGTVMLRALPLLRTLGFKRFHLYGFDSCLRSGAHHAYAQPENDQGLEVEVEIAGRTFICNPWMIAQAHDFRRMIQVMGDAVELAVHGDGLIAHLLTTAAELEN